MKTEKNQKANKTDYLPSKQKSFYGSTTNNRGKTVVFLREQKRTFLTLKFIYLSEFISILFHLTTYILSSLKIPLHTPFITFLIS